MGWIIPLIESVKNKTRTFFPRQIKEVITSSAIVKVRSSSLIGDNNISRPSGKKLKTRFSIVPT